MTPFVANRVPFPSPLPIAPFLPPSKPKKKKKKSSTAGPSVCRRAPAKRGQQKEKTANRFGASLFLLGSFGRKNEKKNGVSDRKTAPLMDGVEKMLKSDALWPWGAFLNTSISRRNGFSSRNTAFPPFFPANALCAQKTCNGATCRRDLGALRATAGASALPPWVGSFDRLESKRERKKRGKKKWRGGECTPWRRLSRPTWPRRRRAARHTSAGWENGAVGLMLASS